MKISAGLVIHKSGSLTGLTATSNYAILLVEEFAMKTTLFSLISLLIWGLLTPAVAQQEGSVAIASAIRPAEEKTFSDFATCVANLKKEGMKVEAAAKACDKIASTVAKTTTRIANEAADATKASRPVVVSPYGYGYDSYYRSGYGSYGYNSGRRAIMHRQQTPPSRRPLPPHQSPSRPATPREK
ncbi:MAG: hypothetical protein AAB672_01750 [Patescibacteria group bacterium]